jgi:hypothetical protein
MVAGIDDIYEHSYIRNIEYKALQMSLRTDKMVAAADEAGALLKALSHPYRLIIVCQLIDKARSVGELADLLKIRDSTVSQLVDARRDGQTVWYSIGSEPARQVIGTLYGIYCAPRTNSRPKKPASRKAKR